MNTIKYLTIRQALEMTRDEIWEGASLEELLDQPATVANLTDIARLPLKALADRASAGPNAVRLYHEVTAMADAANFAPDPTADRLAS